jgi:hypothetical protein
MGGIASSMNGTESPGAAANQYRSLFEMALSTVGPRT